MSDAMSRTVSVSTHQALTWLAGIFSTLATAILIWMGGTLLSVHESQIRMEPIPAQVQKHELRLSIHDQLLHVNTQMQTNP